MQPTLWSPLRRAQSMFVRSQRSAWKRRLSTESERASLVESDAPASPPSSSPSSSRLRTLALLAGVLVALYVVTALPVKALLVAVAAWIREHPFWGTFAAILMFWLAIPLWVPSTIVEAVAGSLFGVSHGVLVILIGKTGGSWLTFLIGRHVGKDVVGGYLETKFPTFRALSEVMNSASWKPVILFQLASIPNLFKCYGLAITKVSSWRFVVSSAVGSTPHAFLWANIGSQASDIAAIISGQSQMSGSKVALLVGGGVLTAVAMGLLVVYTKRELAELQKRECASGSEDEDDTLITIAVDSGVARHSQVKVRANTYS